MQPKTGFVGLCAWIFKVPSPPNSPVDNKDPRYKFPKGRLLSQFIIGLATPFISLRSGSASENGFPKGLVVLIMAALERAVRYLSKPSIEGILKGILGLES